ncbi:MAG: DUF1971 domain-containing protein [bacterium]|nr:DUF1971 domain-containing protein [bacterium]
MTSVPQEFPETAVPGRRTPTFTAETMPAGLSRAHVTKVWAELVVLAGSVLFVDESSRRRIDAAPGDRVLIVPGAYHHVEPSEDAEFFVQFYDHGGHS